MDMDTQYKNRLEEMKENIETELKTVAVYNQETDDWEIKTEYNDTDDADHDLQADASEAADEQVAILRELELQYKNIQRALAKIEAGTYGRCEISGEIIEADRLEVSPAARTCKAHLNEESVLPL